MAAKEVVEPVPVPELAEQTSKAERALSKLRVIVTHLTARNVQVLDVARVPSLHRGVSGLASFADAAWRAYTDLVESGVMSPDYTGGTTPAPETSENPGKNSVMSSNHDGGHSKTGYGTQNKDLRRDMPADQKRPK